MYEAIPIDKFTGLRLDIAPVDVGPNGAVDCLNVDLSDSEQLRVRAGTDTLLTTASTFTPLALVKFNSTYVAVGASKIRVFEFALGSWSETDTVATTLTGGAQVFSSGGANVRLYLGDSGTLTRFDGAAAANVAGSPEGVVYLESWKDRLVAGKGEIGAGSAGLSRVSFSAPADGDTWGADDWVELDPDDGEDIRGVAAWSDELYVFKRSRFYVFYGISTDATGGAVFNYRKVDAGIGSNFDNGVSAGRDGVYFIAKDGVYRTRGGVPERISQPIDPWFTGDTDGSIASRPAISSASPYLVASPRRVFMVTTNWTIYVYEIDNGSWSVWDLNSDPVRALLPADDRTPETLLYTNTGSLKEISSAYTDDDGVAISWHYQSGLYDLADGSEAALRQSSVEGIGTAALKLSADGSTFDTSSTLTLGTAPSEAKTWRRTSFRGRKCSHHLSGSASTFTRVSRVIHHLRDVRRDR